LDHNDWARKAVALGKQQQASKQPNMFLLLAFKTILSRFNYFCVVA